MGWNIFGGIGQALSEAYHATEQGLYDVARAGETLGYEVGTLIKKGHFIPLGQAYQQVGQVSENVPFLGNVSGKQFARIGASYGTQAIPFVGTFGHLASHPNENVFQKGSDIVFGILDAVPVVGDIANLVKKPVETGISSVADAIQNYLRLGSSPIRTGSEIGDVYANKLWKMGLRRFSNMLATPIWSNPIWHAPDTSSLYQKTLQFLRRFDHPSTNPHEWEIKIWQKYHVKPEGPFITYVPPNFWKNIHPNLSHPEPPWKILWPHVKIPPFPKPVVGRLPITPLTKLPLWQRIDNFLKSVSKGGIKFVAPIERLPHLGILNDIAKTIRPDLRVAGVAIDEDPVHILAHDGYGILHDIAITRDGRLIHFIEGEGGAIKLGETAFAGGEDLFKFIRNEVDHIMPFSLRVANFLRSGTLLKTLAGLGIGLSVIGGLVPQGSTGSNTANTTNTGSSNIGGLGKVSVICGQGTVNGYPAVIEVNGTTYYAYGTTPADAEQQGAGIQYVAEGQLPMGTGGIPFPSDPNKVYFVNPDGNVQTYDLSVGQQIIALAQQQCGNANTQGQMNAGSVLQSQLQTLSAIASSQTTTLTSSASSPAISEPSIAPEPSVSQTTTPASSAQPAGSSIFSNKLLWIGIAVIIIIIIIAMR